MDVFSRLALASGVVISAVMIEFLRAQNAFTVSGASFALAGLVVLTFGNEIRGRTLEEIQAIT